MFNRQSIEVFLLPSHAFQLRSPQMMGITD